MSASPDVRAAGQTSVAAAAKASAQPQDQRKGLRRSKTKKGLVLGIDIAPHALRIVAMERSAGRPVLTALREAPYPPQSGPGTEGFPDFLRLQVDYVAGGASKPEIWALIPTAEADLWRVRIPKVPKKRESETFCWAIKRDKPYNEAEMILDFEVQGEVLDKGVPKLQAIAYTVPRKALRRTLDILHSAGITPAGATIPPLALQTACRTTGITRGVNTSASVFIGRNWSRIDIFDHDNLVMSRGVKAGLGSMVEELQAAYTPPVIPVVQPQDDAPLLELDLDKPGSEMSAPAFELESRDEQTQPAPESLKKTELTDAEAKGIILSRLLGEPLNDNAPGAELTRDDVMELIRPALERLVRQIERTFNHYVNTEGGDPVERIFLSGQIAASTPVKDYLSIQIGLDCGFFDPLAPSEITSKGIAAPSDLASRMEYNLTAALALSDNDRTPNLLHTYKDKDREWQTCRQMRAIYASFLIIVLMLAGAFGWQKSMESTAEAKLSGIQHQIAAYAPPVNEQLLLKMASKVQKKQRDLKTLAQKYEGIAVLREVAGLTPSSVKLNKMDLNLGGGAATAKAHKNSRRNRLEDSPRLLILEGRIADAEEVRDSTLASYIVTLQNSPLFSNPVVHNREVIGKGMGSGLHFILHVNVER